jgi:FKBP-type peptidyl-prolyl isomerase-like protein
MRRCSHPGWFAIVIAAALAVAGCGGGGGGKTADIPSSNAPGASSSAPAPEPTPTGPSRPLPPTPGEKELGKKPPIAKPKGAPPAKLVKRDIVKGKGAVAKGGKTVTMQYVGIAYSTGDEFDASWGREPFKFQLGAGMVIPGWDQGIPGMRVGGRRQLVIPPDLAYGAQGQPPSIGPNETLVFDVDLLKVK